MLLVHADGPARRVAGGDQPLRMAIARQRVDDRPQHDDRLDAGVDPGRARNLGIARIVRPHRDQHRQMAAARRAADRDLIRVDLQLLRVRLGPANAVMNVGEGGRIAVRAVAEIQREHDDAALCEILAEAGAVFEVAVVPGAAVQIDIARERPGAFGLEHPRHDLAAAVLQIADVLGRELRHRVVLP